VSQNFGIMGAVRQSHRAMAEKFLFGGHLLVDFQAALETESLKVGIIVYIDIAVIHNGDKYRGGFGKSKRFFVPVNPFWILTNREKI